MPVLAGLGGRIAGLLPPTVIFPRSLAICALQA
jgi:hypothetical protein